MQYVVVGVVDPEVGIYVNKALKILLYPKKTLHQAKMSGFVG